jgi:hypothetical protein
LLGLFVGLVASPSLFGLQCKNDDEECFFICWGGRNFCLVFFNLDMGHGKQKNL